MAYAPYKAPAELAPQPYGVKTKLNTGFATQPVQPPAAQTALLGTSTPEPVFSIGGSTPQPLPPAQNTTLPMGGSNVVASGSGLGTGMAAPTSQVSLTAAPAGNTPNWWSQGATQINPMDQIYAPDGSVASNGMFGMNNYNTMLQGFIGDKWQGGAPDDSSQGYFRAEDVQNWLAQTGNKLMQNSGVGIDGGSDTYQNINWIQDAQGNIVGEPTFNRDDPNGNLKQLAVAAGGYFGGTAYADMMGGMAGASGYAPAMNAATADSAVGTAGYGASSAGAGGGAAAAGSTIAGTGGAGTADQVAFLEANGLSAQEISQITNGAYGYTPADLASMGQISANAPFNQTGTNAGLPEGTLPFRSAGTGDPAPAPQTPSTPPGNKPPGNFFTQNPQLTAGLVSAGIGAIGGNGGNPPAPPSSPGGTGGNPQLTQALQQQMFGNVPGLKTTAGDPNQFYQTASDAAYRNQTRYLDPQVAQQQKALEARLSEQGFVPGTPGYNQAMQNFMDANARAYAQARDTATLQGFQVGDTNFDNSLANTELNNSASNSWLNQIIAMRNQPINERNAIMTGDQIQYNNQLDQYNAQQQTRNSNNQLIGQLATAIGMYFSDARLKDDITPIGQTPGGLGIYSYTIFGRREIGVIAQEVQAKQPHAVAVDPDSGFLMVDYGRIA